MLAVNSTETLRARYLEMAEASKVLSDAEIRECNKLACILRAHLCDKAMSLLEEARDLPALFCYASDQTSHLCETIHHDAVKRRPVIRKGKMLHQFLMERGFLLIRPPSGPERSAVLLREPLPLTEGADTWGDFACGAQFFPMLRRLGHRGICVFHICADRKVFSALDRKFCQRQKAYYTPGEPPPQENCCLLTTLTLGL